MRTKRPTYVLLDQVRITRDGDTATIDHADGSVSRAHIAIGPGISSMTDADIVSMYNDILDAQSALLQEWDKTVVEEPPGEPQIDFHEDSDLWVPRGDVLRCIVDDSGPDGEVTIHIDDQELSLKDFGRLLAVHAGWGIRIAFVPEEFVTENPKVKIRKAKGGSFDAGAHPYCRWFERAITCPSVFCESEGMSDFLQLDLFGDRPNLDRPPGATSAKPVAPNDLSDDELIAAIPDVTLADAPAIAGEAGKRRLSAAVPALTALCNRFAGYRAGAVVPEQVAALNALGEIGGTEAAGAVSKLISRKIVQGPTRLTALTVASQLGVVLPTDLSLGLLRDPHSLVRAATCPCVRAGHEVIATLASLIRDPDIEVATASACALGRMGSAEALPPLKRYLLERPSRRVVEALAGVADEEAVVLLARTGRARRELTGSVISALEEIESPRALDSAGALKRSFRQAE